MSHFSIEAFVKGCKTAMSREQNREQANRAMFDAYCNYLQQQRSTFNSK